MNSKPKPASGAFRPGGVTRTCRDLDAIAELPAPTMAGTREHALKLQAHSCFLTVPGQGVPRLQGHALQFTPKGSLPKGSCDQGLPPMPAFVGLWCVAALLGISAAGVVLSRWSWSFVPVYFASLLVCLAGLAAAFSHLSDGPAAGTLGLQIGLPGTGARFRLDPLAAFFLLVTNLGGALASLYALGYGRHEQSQRAGRCRSTRPISRESIWSCWPTTPSRFWSPGSSCRCRPGHWCCRTIATRRTSAPATCIS